MIHVSLETIAAAIKAARSVNDIDKHWAAGCNSACEYIAASLSQQLRERNADFDVPRFLDACGVED